MLENCIMCEKEIDTDNETYFIGKSLGEYWCHECVAKEVEGRNND